MARSELEGCAPACEEWAGVLCIVGLYGVSCLETEGGLVSPPWCCRGWLRVNLRSWLCPRRTAVTDRPSLVGLLGVGTRLRSLLGRLLLSRRGRIRSGRSSFRILVRILWLLRWTCVLRLRLVGGLRRCGLR